MSTLHKLAQARPKFSKTWAWPMLVWTRKTWARPRLKAGFHLNECNDSAEAARVGACVVGSNVDSPAADLGRIG